MSYPLLLAHGIARFDAIPNMLFSLDNVEDDSLHYFKGIRSFLRQEGFTVYHSNVPWADSVETRADALKENLLKILSSTTATKVNIIAHSMGGLDARHMLYKFRDQAIHKKVATITTISTPHLGTTFADWGMLNHKELMFFSKQTFGISIDGFRDLTTEACSEFNQKALEFENNCDVRFQTIAGQQDIFQIFTPLKVSYHIIYTNELENDGLVSVNSAKWNDTYFLGTWFADHLNEIAWRDLADRIYVDESEKEFTRRIMGYYLSLVRALP